MPSPEEYEEFLAWKAQQKTPDAAPIIAQPTDFKRPKGVTKASEWKKARAAETELTLPSGHVCVVRRPGMVALMREGILPDVFSNLVQEQIDAAEQGVPQNQDDAKIMQSVMSNPDMRDNLFDATDRVTAAVVLEPQCLYHRRQRGQDFPQDGHHEVVWEDIPDNQRDPEALYTDEVDLEDKMFIFQFVVGGTRDLQAFRSQA